MQDSEMKKLQIKFLLNSKTIDNVLDSINSELHNI